MTKKINGRGKRSPIRAILTTNGIDRGYASLQDASCAMNVRIAILRTQRYFFSPKYSDIDAQTYHVCAFERVNETTPKYTFAIRIVR